MKRRTLYPLLLIVLVGNAMEALGDNPTSSESLIWRCWYDLQVHITCLIDSLPQTKAAITAPTYLPAIVQELRNNPETFREQFIHIPLYSPPVDMALAAALAKAGVCGSRTDCIVNFSPSPPTDAELGGLFRK